MIRITNELKSRLLTAQSAEEVTALVKAAGQEIAAEDAEHLWEEIKKGKKQDGRELSLDELESVSGGADRDWLTDGCVSTTIPGSWCWTNDSCSLFEVTYDHEPANFLCPNCFGIMYLDWTDYSDKDDYEYHYRCRSCGHETIH